MRINIVMFGFVQISFEGTNFEFWILDSSLAVDSWLLELGAHKVCPRVHSAALVSTFAS